MKKGRFSEEQIAFALRQAETGTAVAEVIRKLGISEQTFYRWKKQYGRWMPSMKMRFASIFLMLNWRKLKTVLPIH